MVNNPKLPDAVWEDKLSWPTYSEYNSYCFPIKCK